MAECEHALRRERQRDGRLHAKARGVSCGRPKALTPAQGVALPQERAQGVLIRELMARSGLKKAAISRYLAPGPGNQADAEAADERASRLVKARVRRHGPLHARNLLSGLENLAPGHVPALGKIGFEDLRGLGAPDRHFGHRRAQGLPIGHHMAQEVFPYTTIFWEPRTALTISTSCGCCIVPPWVWVLLVARSIPLSGQALPPSGRRHQHPPSSSPFPAPWQAAALAAGQRHGAQRRQGRGYRTALRCF